MGVVRVRSGTLLDELAPMETLVPHRISKLAQTATAWKASLRIRKAERPPGALRPDLQQVNGEHAAPLFVESVVGHGSRRRPQQRHDGLDCMTLTETVEALHDHAGSGSDFVATPAPEAAIEQGSCSSRREFRVDLDVERHRDFEMGVFNDGHLFGWQLVAPANTTAITLTTRMPISSLRTPKLTSAGPASHSKRPRERSRRLATWDASNGRTKPAESSQLREEQSTDPLGTARVWMHQIRLVVKLTLRSVETRLRG